MKGIQGLIIAAGLGVAAMLLNYFYLAGEASKMAMVSFVGIKPDAIVGRGERLIPENLVPVEIPANRVGNLKDFAFLWSEKSTIENASTWRTLSDCSLVLRSDIKTPPPELELGPDERAMWIPVDARAFVPSLVRPGDMVYFKVPAGPQMVMDALTSAKTEAAPKPADSEDVANAFDPKAPVWGNNAKTSVNVIETETIGPFKVLSLGNRLGSADVMRAAKIPQLQENVLTIRVSTKVPGEVERAKKLWSRLQSVNFRQVGIELQGRK